jgi:hypothetical protein
MDTPKCSKCGAEMPVGKLKSIQHSVPVDASGNATGRPNFSIAQYESECPNCGPRFYDGEVPASERPN